MRWSSLSASSTRPGWRMLWHRTEHLRQVVTRLGGRPVSARSPPPHSSRSSLYADVPFRQDISYLSIGERTNANGSKAFREALLAERWDDCVEIARSQIRDGAHMLDLNIDYVGRDGVADMRELTSGWRRRRRCPSCWTPPSRRCCRQAWNVWYAR